MLHVGYFVRSCLTCTKNVISKVQIILFATSCLACWNIRSSAHYLRTLHVRTDGRRSQHRCVLTLATLQPHLCCCWGFICFGYIHLSGRVRFVIKTVFLKGRWRKLSVLISAAPHSTYQLKVYVQCEWDRQTDRQTSLPNTAAWWSKPIDHPISSPINHLLSFALSPTNPPSCTISPFFVPSLPTSFSFSMLLPLTPHSSREVQSGPTCTIHVTNPKQSSTAPGVSNKLCCQQLSVLCWRLDRTNGS